MAQADTSDAAQIVCKCLDELIGKLEDRLNAHLLAFSGRIMHGAHAVIRDAIEWRKARRPASRELAFFLETEGGYIESAQRIAAILRKHYRRVDFFVPDAAMSAGTVLVMSGDAIHMDYYSTLGPIDPQVPKADGTGYVPALGYLKKFEDLMEKAAAGGLTTAEMTYLCTKFDPAELFQYEHARQLSVFLLERWLAKYKFKNWKQTKTRGRPVTPSMRRNAAREVAHKLNDVDRWHTHGHCISMAVLRRDLKLEIEDFGKDKELSRLLREYWGLLVDYTTRKLGQKGAIHVKGRYRALVW